LAHIDPSANAVRADREPVRLVSQPLHKIEDRVPRLEHESFATRHEESLAPRISVRALGYPHDRQTDDLELLENLDRRSKLAAPAIDEYEIGPRPDGIGLGLRSFARAGLAQ